MDSNQKPLIPFLKTVGTSLCDHVGPDKPNYNTSMIRIWWLAVLLSKGLCQIDHINQLMILFGVSDVFDSNCLAQST
jgi:hypothetical protein